MKQTRWLVQVWGDVQPTLHGPFKTDAGRLKKARALQREDEGSLIRLNLDAEGAPHVEPFSGAELPCDLGEQTQSSHEISGSLVVAAVVQGNGNDKRWVAFCPQSLDHKTFETTTVVNQVVLVDEQGGYLSTVDECSQVISGPARDNLWHCSECGEEARWRQE